MGRLKKKSGIPVKFVKFSEAGSTAEDIKALFNKNWIKADLFTFNR